MPPFNIESLRQSCPGTPFHYFASINSTMLEAGKLAAAGAPHGTVVLADEQTAGVGRLGRKWHSEAGLGIYCSVLLRLPLQPNAVPLAALLLGLATAEGIQQSTFLTCDLRWPNDVLIGERKVAGILAQFADRCVIAGIGINVNHLCLPNDLRTPATSLQIESNGAIQSREEILLKTLRSISDFSSMLMHEGPASILRSFTAASSYVLERRITIEESGQRGITAGLDENGFLLVRLEDGSVQRVATGGIRPDR